jgi:hypothetical protein
MEGFPSGIVGGIIAAFAVPLIIWGINQRQSGKPDRHVAKYGAGMKIFLLVGTLFFGVPFVLMVVDLLPGQGTDEWWVRTIFGGFAALFLYSLADGFIRRLSWSDRGIVARNWRGQRSATWGDIDAIDYRPGFQFWRIAIPGGGFGFPETMSGSHAFLEEAYRRGVTIMSNGKPIPGPDDPSLEP